MDDIKLSIDSTSKTIHDLKTPITVIKGYISMVLDGDAGEISDKAKEYLKKACKASEELTNLIEKLSEKNKKIS